MRKATTVSEATKQRNLEGFGLKIKKFRKEANMTAEDLAQALQVTVSSVRNWECGLSRPDPEYLYKLFPVLNVDPNAFFGIRGVGESLTEKEKTIVDLFRTLDDRGQSDYMAIGKTMAHRCHMLKLREVERKIVRLPVHTQYAAAGSNGYWNDDHETDDIFLYNSGAASEADEVIIVSGHSMEPAYHDGDRILVKRCTDMNIGCVYVFSLREMGLVIKKAGEDRLISLNPDYDDIIPSDEGAELVGRVIGIVDASMIPTPQELELYDEAAQSAASGQG